MLENWLDLIPAIFLETIAWYRMHFAVHGRFSFQGGPRKLLGSLGGWAIPIDFFPFWQVRLVVDWPSKPSRTQTTQATLKEGWPGWFVFALFAPNSEMGTGCNLSQVINITICAPRLIRYHTISSQSLYLPICFLFRPQDWSSNLCPPKTLAMWFSAGCFGPPSCCFLFKKRPKAPPQKSHIHLPKNIYIYI